VVAWLQGRLALDRVALTMATAALVAWLAAAALPSMGRPRRR
jgi:hypothetical protein